MFPTVERPRITEIQVRIDCNGCVQKIKKALYGINGIYDVYIDLPQQKLTIIGWADPEKIIKAIKKARKTATICSHSEVQDPPPGQPTEQPPPPPPDNGGPPPQPPPPDGSGGSGPPPPQPEPPRDQQQQPHQPPSEPPRDQPPPPEQPPNCEPPRHHPQHVEEVHVIHHHPPGPPHAHNQEYGPSHNPGPPDHSQGYGPPSHSQGYGPSYNPGLQGHNQGCGPSYNPGPPPDYSRPERSQQVHVSQNYHQYTPPAYVTQYEYVPSSPPTYSSPYARMDNYRYYNNGDYQNDNHNYRNGYDDTSMFNEENPNACTIC